MQQLYWENKAYEIAEKNIFTKEGLTPLESVYNTNVWDILRYVSIEVAKETLTYEIKEQAHNRNKPKRKRK